MKRICPNCGKKVDWKQQIIEWMKMCGNDWQEWATMMVICESCGEYVGEIDFEETEFETKEIKNPALKEKVKVPVGKKK